MTEPILAVTNLTKRFGGFVALDGVDVSLGDKERLGLIGPNGSGKTTLINCISGALFNEQGKVNFEAVISQERPQAVVPDSELFERFKFRGPFAV